LIGRYDSTVGTYIADDHFKTFSCLTTFKLKEITGKIIVSDDASDAKYFDPNNLPKMAFKTQVVAIQDYLNYSTAL